MIGAEDKIAVRTRSCRHDVKLPHLSESLFERFQVQPGGEDLTVVAKSRERCEKPEVSPAARRLRSVATVVALRRVRCAETWAAPRDCTE